jgi:hypothetical protein
VHNESGEVAIFVVETRPALKTERRLEIIFGLAKEGKTNQNGRPRNLLKRGVIAYDYMDEVAVSGVPPGRPEGSGGPARRSRPPAWLSLPLLPVCG